MNIESIFVCISFGIALVNSVAVAGVYWRYIRTARNVICAIRADETGEIDIYDPFSREK